MFWTVRKCFVAASEGATAPGVAFSSGPVPRSPSSTFHDTVVELSVSSVLSGRSRTVVVRLRAEYVSSSSSPPAPSATRVTSASASRRS